jgi:hypothetical protein
MRRRGGPVTVAISLALAVAAVAIGCTRTLGGDAERSRPTVPDPDRSYGYVDDRCGLLLDETVQDILKADTVTRPYSGAVCQYVLSTPSGLIDVVYTWFESGSLDRERQLAENRGATITDQVIVRHPAFLVQRRDNAAACAATAAAGSGVLSWWVQFRPQFGANPCDDAEKLLSATLSGDM